MLSSAILTLFAFGILGEVSGAVIGPAVQVNLNATTPAAVQTKIVEVAVNSTTQIPMVEIANQTTIKAIVHGNLASSIALPSTQMTIVDYFVKVIRGELIGARKCKKDHDCGVGLRCNTLWNWCAPWDAPTDWQDFAKNCTMDSDCGDLYYCLMEKCRFVGPRTCKSTLDCATGISNVTFDCIDTEDLEKRAIVQQLGRSRVSPSKVNLKVRKSNSKQKRHSDHHEMEIESEEIAKFGPTAEGDHLTHGKRCWAQCKSDADCGLLRFPQVLLKENIACCNSYCVRKQSCVVVPEIFRPISIAPALVPTLVKSKLEATPILALTPKPFL